MKRRMGWLIVSKTDSSIGFYAPDSEIHKYAGMLDPNTGHWYISSRVMILGR